MADAPRHLESATHGIGISLAATESLFGERWRGMPGSRSSYMVSTFRLSEPFPRKRKCVGVLGFRPTDL